MLPKLCGSVFYKDRKFPVPIDLTNKKHLAETIDRAIASTYYLQNKGSCSTVKVGFLHRHTPAELVENVALALPSIVSRIPGKWANVQNVELKTGKSAALPIWNCRLSEGEGDGVRWTLSADDRADDDDQEEEDNDEEEDNGEKEEAETAPRPKSGKRRAK